MVIARYLLDGMNYSRTSGQVLSNWILGARRFLLRTRVPLGDRIGTPRQLSVPVPESDHGPGPVPVPVPVCLVWAQRKTTVLSK
jgi:hypothetical protein